MNRYFRLVWPEDSPGPWWLGEVESDAAPLDCRVFTSGFGQDVLGHLRIRIREPGIPLDFTFSAFDVPIVTSEVGEIFTTFAPGAVQRLPIMVGELADKYEVLNVTLRLDTLDLTRGEYLWWRAEDGRPDKVGRLRAVYRMVLQRDIQPPPHVFRIKGWEIALVVSSTLMEALERANVRGVRFQPIEQ